jgi:hypothetical protein
MVAKIIFTIVFFFNILMVASQINLGFGQDCMDKNMIIFSQLLIDNMGEEFVSDLLEKEGDLIIVMEVDSLGHVVNIGKKWWGRKELDSVSKEKIALALKSSDIKFTICYNRTPGISDKSAYELISKDLFKDKTTTWINVSFPGHTLFRYESEKERKKGKKREISRE